MAMVKSPSSLEQARAQIDVLLQSPLGKQVTSVAKERPYTFLFLVVQALMTVIPLSAFGVFFTSTCVVAVGFGIAFIVFWAGVGLLFLVPTIFIALGIGSVVWLWTAAAYACATLFLGGSVTPAKLKDGRLPLPPITNKIKKETIVNEVRE